MSTIATPAASVIGGGDTHKHTHYASVVDMHGRLLGHREIPATDRGYAALLAWVQGHGRLEAIGVESTGSFGATLTRFPTGQGVRVVEENRLNRQARRMDGTSDRLDYERYQATLRDKWEFARAYASESSSRVTNVPGQHI